MRVDELRDELNEVAARAPGGTTDAREVVLARGRRLVRRRRILQTCSAAGAVVVIGAGVALWRSDSGSSGRTIVTDQPTVARTTVPTSPTTVLPVAPLTSVPEASTTVPASTRALVPPDTGYSFTSSPVVSGGSLYDIESFPSGGSSIRARVVRIDLNSRAIVGRSDQADARQLVVAGGRLWIGVGTGGGPFGAPPITRLVSRDLESLDPVSAVTLPAPGTENLSSTANAVWALSAGTAVKVDATQGTIAATVPLTLPASNPYRTIAVSADGTHLYVGWATARQVEGVSEFDAANGHALHENANVGGGPSNAGPDLSFAGTRLWAVFATGMQGRGVALHASDLAATGEEVGGPNSIAITPDGNDVWVSWGTTLDCVDTHGALLASHALDGGVTGAAVPAPEVAYVNTGNGLAVVARAAACPG